MSLRNRLKNREPLFLAWTSLGHPSITEMFCHAPIDIMGIDMEHSTISLEQARDIIATSQSKNVPCLPRIPSHNAETARRLLDSGADGLIIPNVNTVKEWENILSWIKYPPLGKRGYGVARAQGYGWNFDEYAKKWNEYGSIIIQIESIDAVKNIDALLDQEELDGVMVGPYDLSGSLGVSGQLDHPDVKKACDKVVKACQKYGKSCGTQVVEPDQARVEDALKNGFTFIALASDVFLLWKWGEAMKGIIEKTKSQKIWQSSKPVRSLN